MTSKTTLTEKLDSYGALAQSQTKRSKSATEIAGYAAAAGASLAMAGSADATIIYSGVLNLSVEIDPTVQAGSTNANPFRSVKLTSFNMGGDRIDLVAQMLGQVIGTNSGFAAKYSGGAAIGAGPGVSFQGFSTYFLGGDFLATSQAEIGPTGTFTGAKSAGRARSVYGYAPNGTVSDETYGKVPIGQTGVVGIKLSSGNFGWIRLRLDDLGLNQPFTDLLGSAGVAPIGNGQGFADKITMIDWAYEDSGAAIHAGDTGQRTVPEPSSLALLAAGAAGINAFRRRQANRAAR